MKQLIFLIAIIACANTAFGQTAWMHRRDSMLNVLSHLKDDTVKAMMQMQLGRHYLSSNVDSAIYYIKVGGRSSQILNWEEGNIYHLCLCSMVLLGQHKLNEAMTMDSLALAKESKEKRQAELGLIYQQMGMIDDAKNDLNAGLDHYLKAVDIFEGWEDHVDLALTYSAIANIYSKLGEYAKEHDHALKAVRLIRSLKNAESSLPSALASLGVALGDLRRYDSLLVVAQQTKDLAKKWGDRTVYMKAIENSDWANTELYNFDALNAGSKELLVLATAMNDELALSHAWIDMGDYYLSKSNYDSAVLCMKLAFGYAKRNKDRPFMEGVYEGLSYAEMMHHDLKGTLIYMDIRDSMINADAMAMIRKNDEELEAKYSLNKKQTEIDNLTKEQKIQQLTLRQRNTANWALASAVLVIALIAFLYHRNYQQKKRLQQQRITELEKEKQLLAAQAVVQGQVEERARVAKDLHDGLGGILSSAKYSFNNMKDNMIITPENAAAFDKGMALLDQSVNELRRVTHNMMPEALVRFGLDTALLDFCNSIDQSSGLQLAYRPFGLEESTISKTTAIAVYRMVQELVNNILKHAQASTALVQLVRKNDALSITIEDDGKGFDKNILQNGSGMGYHNLRDRVAYLNGTMDIETSMNKGTSVNIEIPNITT